jgi:hypothetical protein
VEPGVLDQDPRETGSGSQELSPGLLSVALPPLAL